MTPLLIALVVALAASGALAWHVLCLTAEVREARDELARRAAQEEADRTAPNLRIHPRRREVAMVACELSGFATFAAWSSARAVHSVVDDYVEILGRSVARHGATVSGFSGDRLVAFFDDELQSEDPVLRALTMATEIQQSMDGLLERWPIGYDLGLRIGIALGPADVSVVAFEDHREWSTVGPAANLVRGLCDEARSGEILLDQRAHAVVQRVVRVEDSAVISLPGLSEPALAISVRLISDCANVIAS